MSIIKGVPYDYQAVNLIDASGSPSTYHCSSTRLHGYYKKYLIQQALAQFDWTIPEEWDKDYFLYVLYCMGFIAVFDTAAFGVVCQQCTLRGLNLYYHPTHAVIANPILNQVDPSLHDLAIGKECEIIKLQPDYSGIMDKVSYYADMMALCDESIGINLINSQTSYVMWADSKQMAETLKKAFDQLHSGMPVTVVNRKAKGEDGATPWEPFTQNVGQNFIADRILDVKETIKDQFLTDLGIRNANTDKRERLVVDEVNANNTETAIVPDMWLSMLRDECKRVREHFRISIDVRWRFDPVKDGGEDNARDTEPDRSDQL